MFFLERFFTALGSLLLAPMLAFMPVPTDSFGSQIPTVVAVFETSLQASITNTDTSMTLVKGTDKAGNAITGYVGFVIDEGTSVEEFVAGNASGTTISSMIRGIDPVTGNTTSSALAYNHRRGASVKISTFPVLGVLARMINGSDTLPYVLSYAFTSTALITNQQHIPNKAYVDSVASSGAANADFVTNGLVELATTSELIAGTATGSTGAYLGVPNLFFNQTSSATNLVPVTGVDGKLSQTFYDFTEAWGFSATSTFGSTTILNGPVLASGTATFDSINVASATFTGIPTLPSSSPSSSNDAVRKLYVDTVATHATSSGSASATGSTSTKMTTLTATVGSDVLVVCAAELTANNQTVTFEAKYGPEAGSLTSIDACTIGSGSGGAGGCSLIGFITTTNATTGIWITNSNGNTGLGTCAALTL